MSNMLSQSFSSDCISFNLSESEKEIKDIIKEMILSPKIKPIDVCEGIEFSYNEPVLVDGNPGLIKNIASTRYLDLPLKIDKSLKDILNISEIWLRFYTTMFFCKAENFFSLLSPYCKLQKIDNYSDYLMTFMCKNKTDDYALNDHSLTLNFVIDNQILTKKQLGSLILKGERKFFRAFATDKLKIETIYSIVCYDEMSDEVYFLPSVLEADILRR